MKTTSSGGVILSIHSVGNHSVNVEDFDQVLLLASNSNDL